MARYPDGHQGLEFRICRGIRTWQADQTFLVHAEQSFPLVPQDPVLPLED